MNANNVREKTKKLYQDIQPKHKLAEVIDMLLIEASQYAENQCWKKNTNYWCLEPHQHKQKLSILCLMWRRMKKGLNIL